MEALVQLAAKLAAKDRLNDDECRLYSVILPYLEMNYRLALKTLEIEAKKAGFDEDEMHGFTPADTGTD